MPFFKQYSGTTRAGLRRLETLVWVLIYGGLLAVLVGLFMSRNEDGSGFEMLVGGVVLAVVGVALIYLRSRLKEED